MKSAVSLPPLARWASLSIARTTPECRKRDGGLSPLVSFVAGLVVMAIIWWCQV